MNTTNNLDIEALNAMTKEEAMSAYETWQDSLAITSAGLVLRERFQGPNRGKDSLG
jgi:hypothetical protein